MQALAQAVGLIMEHGRQDDPVGMHRQNLVANHAERGQVILVVGNRLAVDAERAYRFGRFFHSFRQKGPERTRGRGGNEQHHCFAMAGSQQGCMQVGFVAEFADGLEDFFTTFGRHFSAVMDNAIHRPFGESGFFSDIDNCYFLLFHSFLCVMPRKDTVFFNTVHNTVDKIFP